MGFGVVTQPCFLAVAHATEIELDNHLIVTGAEAALRERIACPEQIVLLQGFECMQT